MNIKHWNESIQKTPFEITRFRNDINLTTTQHTWKGFSEKAGLHRFDLAYTVYYQEIYDEKVFFMFAVVKRNELIY